MTDKPDELESREVFTRQTAETTASSQKSPAGRNSVFPSLLAIAALAASGFIYWQTQQQQLQTLQSIQSLQNNFGKQLNDGKQSQQQTREQLELGISQLQEQLQRQNKSHGDALAEQQARLEQLSEIDRSDWQLAEAEYLLQLANQRLLLMRDTAGVANLLQSVDQILAAMNDSELFPVRKLLADELASIRTAQAVDTEGLYLRIASLAKKAEQLPIILPGSDNFIETTPTNESTGNAENSWLDNLFSGFKQAIKKLGTYVRIQHRDAPLPATLAPEQENLVRRTVQLQFEQAQFALLAANQTLYTLSLQKAHDWLFDLYLADRDATNLLVKEINLLMQEPVVQELPALGAAHNALKNHIELRHRGGKPATPKTPASTGNNSSPIKSSHRHNSASPQQLSLTMPIDSGLHRNDTGLYKSGKLL